MKKTLGIVFILLFAAACTSGLRYTNEELKGFSPQNQEQIKKGQVATGMTFSEVRLAWGAPSDVHVLPPNDQGQERIEWIYKSFPASQSILRFTGGRLTEIISTGLLN